MIALYERVKIKSLVGQEKKLFRVCARKLDFKSYIYGISFFHYVDVCVCARARTCF